MKKLSLLFCSILIITILASVVACSSSIQTTTTSSTKTSATTSTSTMVKPTFNWRWQCMQAEGSFNMQVNRALADVIEEASGGKIKIEVYPQGIIAGLAEIYQAVSSGAVEVGETIPGFLAHEAPSSLLCELAYAARDIYDVYDMYYEYGLLDVMRDEYDAKTNVHLLCPDSVGTVVLVHNFEFNHLSDLQGKLFFIAPPQNALLKYGAVNTSIPGGDEYSALKLHTLDGISLTLVLLKQLNYKEVVKYVTSATQFQSIPNIIVNKNAWNSLGADLQKQIQDAVQAKWVSCEESLPGLEEDAIADAKAYGVKFVDLPPDEEAQIKADTRADWEAVGEMSPAAAEGLAIIKKFLADKNIP